MGHLKEVQWLTAAEVAELWSPALRIPPSIVLREIRLALYKLENEYPYEQNLTIRPPDADLPSPETMLDREFIERFCDKEIWKLPAFWFEETKIGGSFPGRPSLMSAILQELQERGMRGGLASTLAEQSRLLSDWAATRFKGRQTPKAASIENGIRTAYRILQKAQTSSSK